MKRIDFVLAGSLTLLAAAAAWRIGQAIAEAPQSAAGAAAAAPGFETRSVFAREYSPSRALEGDAVAPGHVVLAFEEPLRHVGLAAAFLSPARDGAPNFAYAQNVVAVQDARGLRLGGWMRERGPHEVTTRWFLSGLAWVEDAEGRAVRAFWAPVDLLDLGATGVIVQPLPGETADVTVRTTDGAAVPGASVAIDDARYDSGHFHTYAFTDASGRLRVSGLESDRSWRFSLPSGAGPSGELVERIVRVPDASVVLEVALGGAWTFAERRVRAPFRGASVHFDAVEAADPGPVSAWTTSPWIGPGQGPTPSFWVMRRAGADPGATLRVRARGYEPISLPAAADSQPACPLVPAGRR